MGRRIRRVIAESGQAGVAQYPAETLAGRWLLEAELRAANEQKDRFLAMVSHELRNPLAPILTAVQLLEFSESDDPRLRQTPCSSLSEAIFGPDRTPAPSNKVAPIATPQSRGCAGCATPRASSWSWSRPGSSRWARAGRTQAPGTTRSRATG